MSAGHTAASKFRRIARAEEVRAERREQAVEDRAAILLNGDAVLPTGASGNVTQYGRRKLKKAVIAGMADYFRRTQAMKARRRRAGQDFEAGTDGDYETRGDKIVRRAERRAAERDRLDPPALRVTADDMAMNLDDFVPAPVSKPAPAPASGAEWVGPTGVELARISLKKLVAEKKVARKANGNGNGKNGYDHAAAATPRHPREGFGVRTLRITPGRGALHARPS